MTEIRVLTEDDWQWWRELRLEALTEAAYAFGSRLADWQGDQDPPGRGRGVGDLLVRQVARPTASTSW